MSNLKAYKCHKTVHAVPMTRGLYNKYRGWAIPEDENPDDEGYLVVYGMNTPDFYESWSPKKQFDEGYSEIDESTGKTLGNTDINGAKKNVSDLQVFGNGDLFKLISKASSKKEGWMKSTKAMEIPGVGCVVQVTTQQGDQVAEAVTFVPGVYIWEESPEDRRLVPMGASISPNAFLGSEVKSSGPTYH